MSFTLKRFHRVTVKCGQERSPRCARRGGKLEVGSTILKPAFSVVIPAYNEEAYLPRAFAAIREAETRLGAPVEIMRDRQPQQ